MWKLAFKGTSLSHCVSWCLNKILTSLQASYGYMHKYCFSCFVDTLLMESNGSALKEISWWCMTCLFVCCPLCCPAWLEKDWYYCRRRWSEGTQTKGPGLAPRGMQGTTTSVHTGTQWLVNRGWKILFIKMCCKREMHLFIYRQLCVVKKCAWMSFLLYYYKK